LIGEVSPETYQSYMEAGIPLAYIFADDEASKSKIVEALKPVATKHKGVVNIATIDAKLYGSHAGNLNLPSDKFPSFAIQDIKANTKYPFDIESEITEKSIGDFVQQFVDGKVQPSVKSEPIPEKQEGPVAVVVAKNYKELVIDNDKDVLLEFYAPWCGHCKTLAPKYIELAEMYTSNPTYDKLVTIAKVDATANDVPDQIQGFPTIKLFPAGNKSAAVDYSGDRSIEDLAKFVKEHGKHGVDAYASAASGSSKGADVDDLEEELGEAAKAATSKTEEKTEGVKESIKSAVSGAAEAAKTMAMDTDEVHDEL